MNNKSNMSSEDKISKIPKEVVLKVEEAVVGAGQVRICSAFAPFKLRLVEV